jgi:hypothetical protein
MTATQFNPDGPNIPDTSLGLPGPAEPLPDDDHLRTEPTLVNDESPDDA